MHLIGAAQNTVFPVLRQPPGRYVRSRSAFILCYTLTLVSIAAWLLTDVGKGFLVLSAPRLRTLLNTREALKVQLLEDDVDEVRIIKNA